MQKKVVTLNTILKRSSSINSIHEASIETDRLYNNLIKSPDNITTRDVSVYIEALCSTANAFKYYFQPLALLEKVTKTSISDYIVTEYCNRVIPYMDCNTLNYVIEYIDGCNIKESYKEAISETAKINKKADLILHNTSKLKENGLVLNHRTVNSVIENCIATIDKYNLPSFQKFNLCIEEAFYLLEKNGIKYDTPELIRSLIEHYRYTGNLSAEDIATVLSESYVIAEEDAKAVGDIVYEDPDTVRKILASYANDINNDSFENIVYQINGCTGLDLINNIADIIRFFKVLVVNSIVDYDKLVLGFSSIINTIETYIIKSCNEDCPTLVNRLIEDIAAELDKFVDNSGNESLNQFKNEVYKNILNLRDLYNTLYSKENIANMVSNIEDETITTESVATLAYAIAKKGKNAVDKVASTLPKIFKFQNLITASINLDRYLAKKEKTVTGKIAKAVKKSGKKVANILFGENANSIDYMSFIENNHICIPVKQYSYGDNCYERELLEFVESACKEYNSTIKDSNICVYYEHVGNVFTIYTKDSRYIDTSAINESSIDYNTDKFNIYIDEYASIVESMNNLAGKPIFDIQEAISEIGSCDNFTIEHYKLAMEALQYGSATNMLFLTEKFKEYIELTNENSIETKKLLRDVDAIFEEYNKYIIENYDDMVDITHNNSIRLEAYGLLVDIFEDAGYKPTSTVYLESLADDWDDDDEDEEEEEEKKPETQEEKQKAIEKEKKEEEKEEKRKKTFGEKLAKGLNSIRLGLEGIKYKAKELGNKETEMSRNMDSSARAFAKAIKNCFVTDRREAIIKGSVVPSFSRVVKNGIILAGMGLATQTIVVPCIALLGGLVVSARLTKKERLLLLDEIDTELEVVEKELNIADGNNDMKKYRALLQYKKNLQRQYQRIRYNIRVGKDILPSDAGMNKSK